MLPPRYTLSKEERLKSGKLISILFGKSHSFTVFPFKCLWTTNAFTGNYPVKVVFPVSKRHIRKAVDRNLIRRRMKEAYRKHKSLLYQYLDTTHDHLLLSVMFVGHQPVDFKETEEKIIILLQRLIQEHEKNSR